MTDAIAIQPWDGKPMKYAWPGGYPVFYLCCAGFREESGELNLSRYDRGEFVCCADCLADPRNEAIAVATDINYEDTQLFCEVCNKRIESAYADNQTNAS